MVIVRVAEFTVAIEVSLLEYVSVPVLFDDGAENVKGASPKVFDGIDNAPIVGVAGRTFNSAVIAADECIGVVA
jgi:hypothetical protein